MLIFSKLLIIASLTPAGLTQSAVNDLPSHTKSGEYAWLETDSQKTKQFSFEAKQEVQQTLQRSLNLPKIEKFMFEKYPADIDLLSEVELTKNRKFVLSRRSFENMVSDDDAGVVNDIFFTKSLLPDQGQVVGLFISPSQKYLVIQIQINGNIDVSRYVIYDIAAKKIKGEFNGLSYMQEPSWSSADELVTMHPDSSPRLFSALYVNLADMTSKTILNRSVYKFKNWLNVTNEAEAKSQLTNFRTGEILQINGAIPYLNAFEETSSYFYYVVHVFTNGTIFRLKKQDQATPEAFIAPKEGYWLSTIQTLGDKYVLVNYSRDSLVTLVMYDMTSGQKVSELSLPDNYDLSTATYLPEPNAVELTVANFLGQEYQAKWDIAKSVAPELKLLPTRFIKAGLEYVNRLEYFTSRDGERIPARITYLKNTEITGQNPTYIETYGAFNYIGGYLFRPFGRMKTEFLKRGGILVGTGVRGGAERGYPWYLSGTGFKKANAAYDLIAVADGLVTTGYTQPEKIVSTGTSAGGENVAMAAQLSPSSFGLVIPISGAHDALGYLHIDRWGPQWIFDNLNPYDPQNFNSIFARASLELRVPSVRYPHYFIVCGENDTRVSKVHSYKLKASLDEFIKDHVDLYSVENSGHWPDVPDLHGQLGLKTSAAIWARVYDDLGLKF